MYVRTVVRSWADRLVVAVLVQSVAPVCAIASFPPVLLVENHGNVLVPWIRTGVRGAVVVNVSAHDDCAPMQPRQADRLRRLVATGDLAAVERANGVSDSGLYSIGDYITAASVLGIARQAVWVSPELRAHSKVREHLSFRTCALESLPAFDGPVLLTVDVDFVAPYAAIRCISELEAVRRIAKTLRSVPWNVVHTSVSFSVDGGCVPVTQRWTANALAEALDGKDLLRPGAPWSLLYQVEDWRRSVPANDFVKRVRPLVLKRPADPWLRVYLADGLFRCDSVAGALAEGTQAARLDPGCARLLPELGRQLADMGRLDDAERFLTAAPAVVNIGAELALAQALDRAGSIGKAIKHYSRICTHVANYCAELLIGYAYERLADTARARQHYLRAVAQLAAPVAEMPAFPNTAQAVVSAERFLRATGHRTEAAALRKDPRTASDFHAAGRTDWSGGR